MNASEAIDKMIKGYNFVSYGTMSISNTVKEVAKMIPELAEKIDHIEKLHLYEIRGIFDKASGMLTITADVYDPSQEYRYKRLMVHNLPFDEFSTDEGKDSLGVIFGNMMDQICEFLTLHLNEFAINKDPAIGSNLLRNKDDIMRLLNEHIYIEDLDGKSICMTDEEETKQYTADTVEPPFKHPSVEFNFSTTIESNMTAVDHDTFNHVCDTMYDHMAKRIAMKNFKGFAIMVVADIDLGLGTQSKAVIQIESVVVFGKSLMVNYAGYFQSDITRKDKIAIFEPSAMSIRVEYEETLQKIVEHTFFEMFGFLRKITSDGFTLTVTKYDKDMRNEVLKYV